MRPNFITRWFAFFAGLHLRCYANPVTNNPAFQDGIAAVADSLVQNQNLGVDHLYDGDALGQAGVHEAHADPAGQALGSHTQATGFFRGNVDFQLINAADAVPRPGDIQLLRGFYYKVAGNIGPKRKKNKVVMVSVPLENVINPLITTCLTALGQIYTDTAVAAGTYTKTFVSTNMRSGSTKGWTIAAWTEEYPAATVPSGMTINSTTGVLTYTAAVAGTYYIKILCTDTLAGKPTITGVGFLILTITP